MNTAFRESFDTDLSAIHDASLLRRIKKVIEQVEVIRVVITVSVLLPLLSCSRVDDTPLTVDETMGSLFLFGPKYASLANTNAKPLLYRLLDGPEAKRPIRGSAIIMLGYIGSEVDAANLESRLRENYIGILRPDQWGDVEAIPTALAIMARRGVPKATELLAKMTKPDYWWQTKFQSFEGVHFPYGLTNEMVMRTLVAYAQSGAKDWRERVQAFKEGISDSTIGSVAEWRLETRRIDQAVKEFLPLKAVTVSPETRKLIGRAFNGDFNKSGPASIEQITGTNDLSVARGSNVSSQTSQVLQGAGFVSQPER